MTQEGSGGCSQGGQQSLALLAYVEFKLSGHQGPENALRLGGPGTGNRSPVGSVLQQYWRVDMGGGWLEGEHGWSAE